MVLKRISLHPEGHDYLSKAAAWAAYYPVLSRIMMIDTLVCGVCSVQLISMFLFYYLYENIICIISYEYNIKCMYMYTF